MPQDKIYCPLQVGKGAQITGYLRDDSGENIALKNPNYCELTGQYWAWKNRKTDVKGLVHYRRLFTNGKNPYGSKESKYDKLLDEATLGTLLKQYDLILPKKRNYYIESLWSHYEHSHNIEGLEVTREVIAEKNPDYLPAFDQVMKRKKAHMFNMMIAKSEIFDAYSAWLFDILFEVEKRVDISDYSPSEARIFGYISELLLDVWIEVNQPKYCELPVAFIEGQNYLVKGANMIQRKLTGKYE
ncbi:exopolysaccharide biosynthesis protein [Ligilactobacillus animalis]|nr:exopolysaccharide biosynthesis protein [Ligilactobacillus animalis]